MNDLQAIPPAHVVLLSRLLAGGEKGATAAQLRKDVAPLLGPALEPAVAELSASGLVFRELRGKAGRVTLTDAGRARALETLGLDSLPPKTTWAKLKANHLAAQALGLGPTGGEAARRFATKGGFEAALLKVRYHLPLAEVPTARQATDALLWTLLGVASSEPFSPAAVKRWLLNRALAEAPPVDEKKALRRLIVRSVDARRDAPTELRDAALRRWIAGAGQAGREPAAPPAPDPLPAVLEFQPQPDAGLIDLSFDLAGFAREVCDVAHASPTGRFGASRVFIAHVWRGLRGRPRYERMTLDEFKRRLIEANQARLLDLGRADLVEAMDPEDVRASETRYLGATFHFVRVGVPPP
jgi:hypothetical protein